MKKSKIFTAIIIIFGLAMIVSGIVILSQADKSHTGASHGLSRASTSIEFGGDFYTTSAQATGLAANAATDIYEIISVGIGIFFIFVGGVDIFAVLLFVNTRKTVEYIHNVLLCLNSKISSDDKKTEDKEQPAAVEDESI